MNLRKIVIDDSIYPRNNTSPFNVRRIVMALKTGVKLPPMVIEAKTHKLVDGRHRYEAYTELETSQVDVIEKVYATEADLFADAVRLNTGHGEPLDQYCVRNAIIRLTEYGYQREQIMEAVRLPLEQIEKITRGFASDETTGKPIALKGGLDYLKGRSLSAEQQERNRHYGGQKATFYVRQIRQLLEHDMWPDDSMTFAHEMDLLVDMWSSIRSPNKERSA